MKKVLIAVLLAVMVIGNVAAIDVTFGTVPDSWGGALSDEIQAQIIEKVNERYGKYEKGGDFGRAMTNSGSLAATSGYMRTANGYDWISVALSANMGVGCDNPNEIKDFIDNFRDDGDVYFGVGAQLINAAIGFNVGQLFKWEHGLYLTLKGGLLKYSYKDYDFESYNLGFMVNYQLINDVGARALKWRGINVGAGFTYYSSKMDFTVDKLETIKVTAGPNKFHYDADLDVEAETSRCVIPVEITTGVKLAIVEIFGGIGADFMFGGKNELSADSDAVVSLEGNDDKSTSKLHLSKDGDDDNFKMKFTVGIGFSLGPVHIEIPYTQYFDEKLNSCIGVIGGVAF